MAMRIQRREVISTLCGMAITWPLAVHAQQPAMPMVGLVNSGPPEVAGYRAAAFRQFPATLEFGEA